MSYDKEVYYSYDEEWSKPNRIKPYYLEKQEYPVSNTKKGELGERAFYDALSDYPVFCNITFGHRQKDIDHLVLTCDCLVFNECKNVKESFQMHYSWFLSHVVDRFADGLPVAQYYARSFGYSTKHVIFTLTIPCLNTDPPVHEALRGLKIRMIQTGKQLTEERDKKDWCFPVRRQFLSVINTTTSNNTYTDHIYTFTLKKKVNRYKVATSRFLFSTRRRKPFLKRFMHDHK